MPARNSCSRTSYGASFPTGRTGQARAPPLPGGAPVLRTPLQFAGRAWAQPSHHNNACYKIVRIMLQMQGVVRNSKAQTAMVSADSTKSANQGRRRCVGYVTASAKILQFEMSSHALRGQGCSAFLPVEGTNAAGKAIFELYKSPTCREASLIGLLLSAAVQVFDALQCVDFRIQSFHSRRAILASPYEP